MYILEGNIGVGKSTFLRLLSEHLPQINVVQEPKENWTTQASGQSLLESFYQNPQRWAYTIETLAMVSRIREQVNAAKKNSPTVLFERSVYSGHYCFAKNGYTHGFLSDIEWEIYSKWVDLLVHQQKYRPQGFVYLQAQPDTCHGRVLKRNRVSEKSMSLEYIKQIHHWHEEFLVHKNDIDVRLKKIPILILNCNEDFLHNKEQMGDHAARVKEFLKL